MKKTLFVTIIMCMFASSAWALFINGTDTYVGDVDNMIKSGSLPRSADDTAIDWVTKALRDNNYISEDDEIVMNKDENYTYTSWNLTDQANTYALDFSTYQPDFFFIKIGTGSLKIGDVSSDINYFLYENLDSLDWGVVNLAVLGFDQIIGVDRISHVGEINGTAPVPEPATMLLLGAGLLGLAGFRRKMKN